MTNQTSYQCPECGLHYESAELVQKCEQFCKENRACSTEIAKHSLEASDKK